MAGKGHAKGTIKGADVLSSVVIDTSNAERELRNFITKVNNSKKQIEFQVGIDALKHAKTIWDEMRNELQRHGETEIFKGLAETFDMADKAFQKMKTTLNGKEIKGFAKVIQSLSSADFDSITKIDFGIDGIKNNILEMKKLEAATESAIKSEKKLSKERAKNADKSDAEAKIRRQLTKVKRQVGTVSQANLEFRIDTGNINEIESSTAKLERWAEQLTKCKKELDELKKSGADGMSDIFQDVEAAIENSLENINNKIVNATEMLRSASVHNPNVSVDIGINAAKLKKQADATRDLAAANDKLNDSIEKTLKLSRVRGENVKFVPQTYTAVDGKYLIEKGSVGYNVYDQTGAGYGELIASYDTLRELRTDMSLITEQESKSQEKLTGAIESTIPAIEEHGDALDNVKKKVLNIEEANKQMAKTAELVANLQSKYGDNFEKEFTKVIDSFGGLNVDNASAMYDALIAKEQEYSAEIKNRVAMLTEFTTFVNDGYLEFMPVKEFGDTITNLSQKLIDGKIKIDAAKESLIDFVSEKQIVITQENADANEKLISSYEGVSDAAKQAEQSIEKQVEAENLLSDAVGQVNEQLSRQEDLSRIVSRDVISQVTKGVDIEGLLSSYGLRGDDLTRGVDLFKDFAGARYLGEASLKDAENILSELTDFVIKNAQRTEEVVKTMNDFREYMKLVQIRIPENMELDYASEFTDEWKNILKLYAIGGNSKNKKKLITTSKYASTPDVLVEELIKNGFGYVFDQNMMSDFNGSAQDSLKMLLDAIQRAKNEFKLPNMQTLTGLDEDAADDFSAKLVDAVIAVERNLSLMQPAVDEVGISGAALADSFKQASDSEKELLGTTKQVVQELGNQSGSIDAGLDDATEKAAIFQGELKSILQIISAAAEKSNFNPLKNIETTDDVHKGFETIINDALGDNGYKYAGTTIRGDTGIVQLKNDIGNTIDAVFRLSDGVLQLDENLSRFRHKPVDFNLDVALQDFDAEIRNVKASLGGLKYDGMSNLEGLRDTIIDEDSFEAAIEQIRIAKKDVAALKKEYSNSTKTLNDVGRASEKMRQAERRIDTMQMKVDRLGDAPGVDKLTEDIERMTEASERFNDAQTEREQLDAHTAYSKAKSDFDTDYEYAKEAKRNAEAEAKAVAEEDQRIKQLYQEILNTVTRINSLDVQIEGLKGKNTNGIYTDLINQLQAEKETLIQNVRSVSQQVGDEFGNGILGQDVNLSGARFFTAEDTANVNAFLSNARVQAALAKGDVTQLQECLNQLSTAFTNSAKVGADAANRIRTSMQEASKIGQNLFETNDVGQVTGSKGFSETNQQYQEALKAYQMLQIAYASLGDKPETEWTAQEAAAIQILTTRFIELGSQLDTVAQKQQNYFSGKTAWTDPNGPQSLITQTEAMKTAAEESGKVEGKLKNFANSFAQNMGASGAIITNFTQSADGISRLDFSVLDEATLSIKKFKVETGTAMDGKFFPEELTSNKSLANIKSAYAQLESMGDLIGRMRNVQNVNVEDGSSIDQIQKLLTLSRQLESELTNPNGADQGVLSRLIRDSKLASAEVEKLYRQMMQMEGDIASGKATSLGMGDSTGDIYGQLVDKANEYAAAQQGATLQIGKFDQATNTLNASLLNANGTVSNLKFEMSALNGQMTVQQTGVGKLTTSWDQFRSIVATAGKRLGTALVGYNIFFKAISEVRKGIGYVKEIDLALTELKKVTDETEASYANFLKTASKTAGEIGSTVSDFTAATANFARLGYSMEESADMAKTAVVYKNVADGLDTVDEATDSIISTMKAFGIESDDTMSIIDRFNEVGNKFAITSAGIGDALQRSASALYAAGNTIDESIALVTAANSVVYYVPRRYSNIVASR